MSRYDIVCIHTIVGWAPAHAAHFSVKLDGTIQQSRDTAYQSAGNLIGNPRVIVIENEDGAKDIPLTAEQVEANAQILAWAHGEHGVPLQLCPDSRPGSRGLGVHRQGIDGNFTLPAKTLGLPRSMWLGRVPGGEVWTYSTGKVCPRDNKIAQVPEVLARAKGIVEGDSMADYAKQLNQILRQTRKNGRLTYNRDRRIVAAVAAVAEAVESLADNAATKEQVRRVRGDLAKIGAEIAAEQPEADE